MNFEPETLIRLALGLALFGFGWNFFKIGLNAIGFGVGFLFGSSVYEILLSIIPQIDPEWLRFFPTHSITPYIVGCVTGVLGVLLSKRLFMVLVFLATLTGLLYLLYADEQQRGLVESLFTQLGILESLNQTLGNAWPALLAFLISLLVLVVQKQVVIILTACAGSYLIADTINIPIIFLPLCFIGFLLQQKQKKKQVKKVVVEEE